MCKKIIILTLVLSLVGTAFGVDKATSPSPSDGGYIDPVTPQLGWTPGDSADIHELYYGIDYNDVNDANNASPPAGVTYDSTIVAYYYLDPNLAYETAYYWRIDESADPNASGSFSDQTIARGFSGIGVGGAKLCDFDNDGWVDVDWYGIWKNNEGNFTEIDTGGGYVFGDYNDDGYLDLYHGDEMLLNVTDGNGTSFVVDVNGIPSPTVSRGSTWGDWDNDGDIDIYVGGYENWATNTTYPDMIIDNNNHGEKFEKIWEETVYRARGVTACDFDQDYDVDIYVTNYRLQPNRLWLNNGSGSFSDVASSYGAQAGSGHGIGSAWGDFDNDGYFDIFAGNFSHSGQPQSRFLQNDGPPNYHFADKGTCGVFWQESYATPAAGDIDNDGDLDLYFTTIYAGDDPVLFRNDGDWTFTDVTSDWGLSGLGGSYCAAFADIDNDGFLDLFTDAKLFVNQSQATSANHCLKVKLISNDPNVNKFVVGAQVVIEVPGLGSLTRQVETGTGESNQNDMTMHFGLASHSQPVELEIFWPDGNVTYVDTPVNRFVKISQSGIIDYNTIRDTNMPSGDYKGDTWNFKAAPIEVNQTDGSTDVNEQSTTTDTYTVALAIAPDANVTITVDPDTDTEVNNQGEGNTVDLIFTTADWNTPQTITVKAIDDAYAEEYHTSIIAHTAASTDADFNEVTVNLTAYVTDNDTFSGLANPDDFEKYGTTTDWNPTEGNQGWAIISDVNEAHIEDTNGVSGSHCLRSIADDTSNAQVRWYGSAAASGVKTLRFDTLMDEGDYTEGNARVFPYFGSAGNGENWLVFEGDLGSTNNMKVAARTSGYDLTEVTLPGEPSDPNDFFDTWYTFEMEFDYSASTVRAR
ncbi:CRTAC1 family protein, partial [Planctomycetota bacterium]